MTQATPDTPRDTRPTVAGEDDPDTISDLIVGLDEIAEGLQAGVGDREHDGVELLGKAKRTLLSLEAKLAREKQETEDLRKVILESLESDRQSNEAMSKAINPNGEKRDFIPAARELHARIAALEAALVKVASMFVDEFDDETEQGEWAETRAILTDLGLAHRVWGNQSQAKQVTA